MKYISVKSIDRNDFKKNQFVLYDTLEAVVKNNANSSNLYTLKVVEEDNIFNSFIVRSGLGSNISKFKNHHTDSTGKVVKILDKVSLHELNNAKPSIAYLYNYTTKNAARLKSNSLGIIAKFLIEKNADPELLISLCIMAKKFSDEDIAMIEDYIFSKIIDIHMVIEFANKVSNCNIDKLMCYILEYYSDDESLILFVNSVNKYNIDSVIEYLVKKDTCPNLSNSMRCLKSITNRNFNFSIVEDAVIDRDKKGKLIFTLAKQFNGIVDIDKLSRAMIEVDKQGFMCLKFLLEINGCNSLLLEEAIASKDKLGAFCKELALRPNANIEMLTDKMLNLKNKSSWAIINFVEAINKHKGTGYFEEKLLEHMIEDDTYNSLDIYKFLTSVSQLSSIAIQKAVDKIKENNDNYSKDILVEISKHTILKVYL